MRDIAVLNKIELLPWDLWGLLLQDAAEERYSMRPAEVLALLGLPSSG